MSLSQGYEHGRAVRCVVTWTRDTLPLPPPLPPIACERPAPGVMQAGNLALLLTLCSIWESRSCTCPWNTVELILVVEARASWPEGKHGRAGPTSCLPCLVMGEGKMPTCPLPPKAGRRAGPACYLLQHSGQ